METDPRIWFWTEIGRSCPLRPSRLLPSLLFLPCPFHSPLWDIMHVHSLPQMICTLVLQGEKGSLSRPLTSASNKSIWQREGESEVQTQSTHCAASQIHFRLVWAQVAVYDFQESASSKWSLSDAELYDHHKAQMERQKTQVMQEQICLQMYLLTASWQDRLFTILCKQS